MWPLISPASGALSSAILVLISEWPVFHISGVPPARWISSNSAWLAFTSAMMVAPGWLFSTSRAHRIMQLVAPQDAALAVDRADAVAVAVEGDAEVAALLLHLGLQLLEVLRHRRVGMVRREGAVDLLVQDEVRAGQLVDHGADRHADGAVAGVPGDLELAAGLHVLQQPRGIVVEHRASARRLPLPVSKSPLAAISPSFWMSAPKNDFLPIIILKPLKSGGLCEPVIWMPPSASRCQTAK